MSDIFQIKSDFSTEMSDFISEMSDINLKDKEP